MKRMLDPRSNDARFAHRDGGGSVHAPHHPLNVNAGRTLYLYGDQATSLYQLEHGMVRVARMTPDGGIVTVRHVLPGDFFGEEAIQGERRMSLAEALTDACVMAVDPDFLDANDVQIILRSLSAQMQRMMEYGYHLQTGDLRARVARYIAWLAGTPLRSDGEDGHPNVAVTHEMIAEGTGSTRESVSKIVTELRSDGLIASGYRAIVLLDLPGLQLISEGL